MIPPKDKNNSHRSFYVIVYPTILFVLSIILILPQFTGEFTQHARSVEPTIFSFVNFLKNNFGHSSWNPQWYLGFPSGNFSPPLVPYFLATMSLIIPVSVPHLYRIILGIILAIQPISWYFFVLWLSKKPKVAIIFSLIFAFSPSISFLIPPLGQFAQSYYFAPWRIISSEVLGEGIKVIILTLLPFLLAAYLKALENPSYKKVILSSVLFAFLLLIDVVTFFSSVIFITSVFFAQMFLGHGERKLKTSGIILLITAGLVSFWYSISFIQTVFSAASLNGQSILSVFIYFFKIALAFLPVILGIFSQKGSREKKNMPFTIAVLSFLSFAFVILIFYISNPDYLTEYARFIVELDIATALIVALLLNNLFDKLKQKNLAFSISIILILVISANFLFNGSKIFPPNSDIGKKIEYQISSWINKNYSFRTYLTGSSAFWFNVFTRTPQIRGGADHGSTNPVWADASYQIQKGKDAETSILWLKALRASSVVVNSHESEEIYHDFAYPEKFENQLELIYDNRKGDKIYKVQQTPIKLTQIVDQNQIASLYKPQKGDDKENLAKYVNTLGNLSSNNISEKWLSNEKFEVSTELENNQVLDIGITFDPGWKAKVNGRNVRVQKDVLGNILIAPKQEGKINMELSYQEPFRNYLGYVITLATILLLFFYPKNPQIFNKFFPKVLEKTEKDEELEY